MLRDAQLCAISSDFAGFQPMFYRGALPWSDAKLRRKYFFQCRAELTVLKGAAQVGVANADSGTTFNYVHTTQGDSHDEEQAD
jgi:hypothetical protein